MKRLVTCGIAFIALAMSGWSSASTLDISELCGDFELFKNPETRIYRGQFEDKQGVTLHHVLVITQTTHAGEALAFYIHGKQPKWKIKKSGCSPRIAMIDGDTLTLGWRYIKVTYVFDDDGTASVKYVSKRRDGTTRTTRGKVALEQ